jgi:hypothetical protein
MSNKRKKPETPEEWEALVMQFIASLTLCDHMGDVMNNVGTVLETLGHEVTDADGYEWCEMEHLQDWLGARKIKTLQGTDLS